MNPSHEALLLRLVEKHLRVWSCKECGRRWLTGRSDRALFHQCDPAPLPYRKRRRVTLPTPQVSREDFLSVFGAAAEEALGERALLPVESEEE